MKKFGAELKRHALTAISYMLPLVVASGLDRYRKSDGWRGSYRFKQDDDS